MGYFPVSEACGDGRDSRTNSHSSWLPTELVARNIPSGSGERAQQLRALNVLNFNSRHPPSGSLVSVTLVSENWIHSSGPFRQCKCVMQTCKQTKESYI